jgi:flagellar hook-length control protein FliK
LHQPGELAPRWSERVVDAVRLSALRGGGEIRLQLEPEGLGHIDVRLHLQSDGVRAVIVAEHESTRALLTSQQQVLQDAFTRSDVRLSGFSVDVGSGGGAASFARPDEGGQGAGTAAPPPPATTTADTNDDRESAVPLANGRVSVRV